MLPAAAVLIPVASLRLHVVHVVTGIWNRLHVAAMASALNAGVVSFEHTRQTMAALAIRPA